MPLFVRAGAIVPVGPVNQYVDEKPNAPLTMHVYTGADGTFSLYEDDGVSNDFGKGAFARIPMRWDEAAGTLTIGAREGGYDGMTAARAFRVRFVGPRNGGFNPDAPADRTIAYSGAPVTVSRR